MSLSEVFRPSNGDLYVRDNISNGVSIDPFRKRPATQGGYRFGRLSHNSFFTRHNPHPSRVRHLKGLLDVPICAVNDDGYFSSPRYSLQFPPNGYNITKLANSIRGRIPVNALNVNSQLHPINTITGLQYFTGLNSFSVRDKANPNLGQGSEAWRDELKAFTDQLSHEPERRMEPERTEEKPRTTQYSTETGRLIPPPSRAMTRGGSRRGRPLTQFDMQQMGSDPDTENIVMAMLCQILQTEDVNAVQSWLMSAGEREKSMVMDMIKAGVESRAEYGNRRQENSSWNVLPPIHDTVVIGENEDMIDRLTLHEEPGVPKAQWRHVEAREPVETMPGMPAVPPPESNLAQPVPPPDKPSIPMKAPTPKPLIEDEGCPIKVPTNDVFKATTARPGTNAGRELVPPGTAEARLKYTKSPLVNGHATNMWNQQNSTTN